MSVPSLNFRRIYSVVLLVRAEKSDEYNAVLITLEEIPFYGIDG